MGEIVGFVEEWEFKIISSDSGGCEDEEKRE